MIMKKISIKNKLLSTTMALLTFTALGVTAYADDAKPTAITGDQVKDALGMSVYVQSGYTYNFQSPDSMENDLRVFDHKADSFIPDLAELQFFKDAPVGEVGYKLKISDGETAKFIHSTGLNEGESFDLTEAYLMYNAPIGKGLKFTLGKFATYLGAEVIEARDNPNYSRSFLFNYAIAFTHTGMIVSYPVADNVSASFYAVNGWDAASDNNKGKSFGASLSITPVAQFTSIFNVMYGPEQTDNTNNKRFIFDWVGTIKPVGNLSIILNADYGTEKMDIDGGSVDTKWSGISGIVKYDINDLASLSLRAEYFDDKNGVRTGTVQKLKEITFTPEFRVAKGLIIRPEYRYDMSDKYSFNSGAKKNQNTIALGVMYTW
jgi:hypothetical protein